MKDRTLSSGQARVRGLLAIAAVLLASGAVGFISYSLLPTPRVRGLRTNAPADAPAAPPGAATATVEPPAPAPAKVPDTLPELSLPGIDGKTHRLADWKGHPLVINFWATWCDPCRREIPLLKSLRRENAPNGIEVVGIAVDYSTDVRKYAVEHSIDYPLLLGERDGLKAAAAFGMETVLPFSVFADGQGRVVTLKVGELHRDEAELILGRMRDLEAGRLSLATAQAEISAGVRALREARAAQN